MRNKGPFWHTKLSNKTFRMINLILLALIYIVGLIFMLKNLGANSVIKSIINFGLIVIIIYIMNLLHAIFILKIRNRLVFKKSYYSNIIANSLLVVILLPNIVLWWLLPLSVIISYIVAYYINKFAKEKIVHLSILTLIIIYGYKIINSQIMTPSLWLDINTAQILTALSGLGLVIMLILQLIKSSLVTSYTLCGTLLFGLLFILKLNDVNLILNNALFFIWTFILLDNEVTPITKRAILLVVMITVIWLGILFVYLPNYLLIGILISILILNLIRKKLDIWLLFFNKK